MRPAPQLRDAPFEQRLKRRSVAVPRREDELNRGLVTEERSFGCLSWIVLAHGQADVSDHNQTRHRHGALSKEITTVGRRVYSCDNLDGPHGWNNAVTLP